MEKIVVYGAGGHARVVADILQLRNEYEISGYLEDTSTGGRCAPILGGEEQLELLSDEGIHNIIIGFGNNSARMALAKRIKESGLNLVSAVHPKSIIAYDSHIGLGSVVCAGAVICPLSYIGENVIINTLASVDHNCYIYDGTHISPGVHLAGRVTIMEGSWICIGATIINDVVVGAGSIIGAGSVVVNNIPSGVVAYGVPAKIIREVKKDDW